MMVSMADEVSGNLRSLDQHQLDLKAAHWVMPGPLGISRCLYFETMTGELIFAQSDFVLTES
eukprot:8251320-Pyramimonas_sp.AAC.1